MKNTTSSGGAQASTRDFADISILESRLGYGFRRRELLEQALTHTSRAREDEPRNQASMPGGDNEQFEFLGDAVLGFVSAEELCRRFPQSSEGELSKLRAHLVSQKHLIRIANELDLGSYLRLGRGEEKSGGRRKTALLVDALEAILAALYMDGGIEPAREFIVHTIMDVELQRLEVAGSPARLTDYKSALQEMLQAAGRPQPVYVLVNEHGPEHKKTFTVEVRVSAANGKAGEAYAARAAGSTKKSAEQESARLALEYLAAGANSEGGPTESDAGTS